MGASANCAGDRPLCGRARPATPRLRTSAIHASYPSSSCRNAASAEPANSIHGESEVLTCDRRHGFAIVRWFGVIHPVIANRETWAPNSHHACAATSSPEPAPRRTLQGQPIKAWPKLIPPVRVHLTRNLAAPVNAHAGNATDRSVPQPRKPSFSGEARPSAGDSPATRDWCLQMETATGSVMCRKRNSVRDSQVGWGSRRIAMCVHHGLSTRAVTPSRMRCRPKWKS